MITGRDFIVFSDDWGRHPSSCQHLFRRLAPKNRVLWVNTIGTRTPSLSRADAARAWQKMRSWTARRPASSNDPVPVEVVNPFMTPFDRWKPARQWNAHLLQRAVLRESQARGMERPILLTTIPNAAGVAGAVHESIAVYYCVDDFSEWPGSDRRAMMAMEADLLRKVDLVLATSEKLFEERSARHPRVRLLRHGVDWSAFHEGRGKTPAALAGLPHPRIGMTGLIDERIDVELVQELARAFPKWAFVFLGPRLLPQGPLEACDNVHFLPPVAYHDVPAVLHAFDAAFIPYAKNRLSERINPLKLRECLAAGIPVVASRLPEAERYSDVLETAQDPGEWKDALRRAVEEGRRRSALRSERVREESWEARAEEFSRHVLETEALVRPAR